VRFVFSKNPLKRKSDRWAGRKKLKNGTVMRREYFRRRGEGELGFGRGEI
jgi:hypothetical protein